ncbi:Copper chaperone CopZ [Corynebacterium ciconiae DSM 44920]|uniref:heavy-metal-associated domain-containing protein n=1 Tax=Corynebacterium ciconiae TaxID=227319 RepID=UPI00037AB8A6|nr:heavy-metal-associated domain-containing protein [Corynebacterium ciconiae]WKD62241.1 Copper chaperone CopZ [Corynebacterium ciconiae DSM 44920]
MGMKNYNVKGMTCDHCAKAVEQELEFVAGTQGVDVDVERGIVRVTGQGFTDDAVTAAIEEAGYEVVED